MNDFGSVADRFNSILSLAVALGTQTVIRDEIRAEYEKDEEVYYWELTRLDPEYKQLFDKFTLETSESIKQVYAIIMNHVSNSKTLFIDRMLKKAYRFAFNYYHNKKISGIMLEMFNRDYVERQGGLEKVSGIYLDYSYFVINFLVLLRGGALATTPLHGMMESHIAALIYDNPKFRLEKLEKTLDLPSALRKKLEQKTNEFLDKKVKSEVGLGEDVSVLLENIKLKEERFLLEHGANGVTEADLRNMPIQKITNVLFVILSMCGIDGSFAREASIDEKFVKGLVKTLHLSQHEHNLSDREVEVLFVSSLLINVVATEYNKVRGIHYEGLKTKMQQREEELSSEFKSKIETLEREVESKDAKIAKLSSDKQTTKNLMSSQEKELKRMEKELKRLQLENDKLKENESELNQLREFFLTSNDEIEEEVQDVDVEELVDKLSKMNGAIIGGHTNLRNKIKELLPNYTIISPSDKTKELNYLKNKDIVFYISSSNNHSMYYKVLPILKTGNKDIVYLKKRMNVELVLKDMYEQASSQTSLLNQQ